MCTRHRRNVNHASSCLACYTRPPGNAMARIDVRCATSCAVAEESAAALLRTGATPAKRAPADRSSRDIAPTRARRAYRAQPVHTACAAARPSSVPPWPRATRTAAAMVTVRPATPQQLEWHVPYVIHRGTRHTTAWAVQRTSSAAAAAAAAAAPTCSPVLGHALPLLIRSRFGVLCRHAPRGSLASACGFCLIVLLLGMVASDGSLHGGE
jgi:hypothetical protein